MPIRFSVPRFTPPVGAALLIGSAMIVANPAFAAGTKVYVQTWNPAAAGPGDALTLLIDRPEGLDTMVRTTWTAIRATACDTVRARLPAIVASNLKGAVAKEIICEMGPATDVSVIKSGTGLTTYILVPNNTVRLKVELDGGRPDFYIDVPFSISTYINAKVGDPGRLLTLGSVVPSVHAGTVKVDGATPVGDLLLKAANLAGINIPSMIANGVNSAAIPMGTVIDTFNTALSKPIIGQVQQAVAVSLWQQNGTTIFVLTPRFPSVPRAPLSGTVLAAPGMPDCGGWAFTASADGPGKLVSPFSKPPGFTRATMEAHGESARVGGAVGPEGVSSERRCAYRIADAPIGSAARLEVANGHSNKPGRIAMLTPGDRAVRAPAVNVDFRTTWGVGGSADYLESRFKPQIKVLQPGVTAVQPGTRVTTGQPRVNAGGGVRVIAPVRKKVIVKGQ